MNTEFKNEEEENQRFTKSTPSAEAGPPQEQIIDYLDCEFSVGHTRGGSAPWAIEQSTLPWREGHRLEFVDQVSLDDQGSIQVPLKVGEDKWTVPLNTLNLDEIKALFGRRSNVKN